MTGSPTEASLDMEAGTEPPGRPDGTGPGPRPDGGLRHGLDRDWPDRNPADPAHPPVTKAPIIDQTGQPSVYPSLEFPGDGVNFSDVTHSLFYWLVDCHGNTSVEQAVNITIKPRPKVN